MTILVEIVPANFRKNKKNVKLMIDDNKGDVDGDDGNDDGDDDDDDDYKGDGDDEVVVADDDDGDDNDDGEDDSKTMIVNLVARFPWLTILIRHMHRALRTYRHIWLYFYIQREFRFTSISRRNCIHPIQLFLSTFMEEEML